MSDSKRLIWGNENVVPLEQAVTSALKELDACRSTIGEHTNEPTARYVQTVCTMAELAITRLQGSTEP